LYIKKYQLNSIFLAIKYTCIATAVIKNKMYSMIIVQERLKRKRNLASIAKAAVSRRLTREKASTRIDKMLSLASAKSGKSTGLLLLSRIVRSCDMAKPTSSPKVYPA
jgi:hypothetical protein